MRTQNGYTTSRLACGNSPVCCIQEEGAIHCLSWVSRSFVVFVLPVTVVGHPVLLAVCPERTYLPPDLHDPRADATPVNGSNKLKTSRRGREIIDHQHIWKSLSEVGDAEDERHVLGLGYGVQRYPLRPLAWRRARR